MIGRKFLEECYQHVTTAASASEAIALLKQHPFDLVLTDISMPGMDGSELQQYIAKQYPDLPVIAVTGNVLPEQRQEFMSRGFKAVVEKPILREKLVSTIEQVKLHKE